MALFMNVHMVEMIERELRKATGRRSQANQKLENLVLLVNGRGPFAGYVADEVYTLVSRALQRLRRGGRARFIKGAGSGWRWDSLKRWRQRISARFRAAGLS